MDYQLLTVKFRINLEYIDEDYYCKLSALNPPYSFIIKLQNNIPIKGTLTKDDLTSKPYRLTKEELTGLKVLTESDTSWIKELKLSYKLLSLFLFAGAKSGRNSCVPPENIILNIDNPIVIDFGISHIDYLLPTLINSSVHTIYGKNQDKDCQIKLSLTQVRE